MPKTKFQKLVFGTMMALIMVYGMEVYNAALRNGGLTQEAFVIPIWEVVVMGLLVMVLEAVLAGPLARKIAFKIIDGKDAGRLTETLALSVVMVCLMCPLMSLSATLIFQGGSDFPAAWLRTFLFNFPMAFCWQLLIAGPLVRLVFRTMFRKKEVSAA